MPLEKQESKGSFHGNEFTQRLNFEKFSGHLGSFLMDLTNKYCLKRCLSIKKYEKF